MWITATQVIAHHSWKSFKKIKVAIVSGNVSRPYIVSAVYSIGMTKTCEQFLAIFLGFINYYKFTNYSYSKNCSLFCQFYKSFKMVNF